jgi:translation initiation factor IF-2
MEKIRIRDLARELGMDTSKDILAFLVKVGQKGLSASSNLEGDLVERVKAHFRKAAAPPPPPVTTTVTKADGTLERKSSKVVLRRAPVAPPAPPEPPPVEEAPAPPPAPAEAAAPAAPPAPPAAVPTAPLPAAAAAPPVTREVPPPHPRVEPPVVPSRPETPSVRVIEKPAAPSKPEDERKAKEKEKQRTKTPPVKKVQKGVLKKHIIEEIVEETEGAGPAVPVIAAEEQAEAPVAEVRAPAPQIPVRQFQPSRHGRGGKKRGKPDRKAPSTQPPKASKMVVKIEEVITVGDLAHRMGVKAGDVIRKLMIEMGMPATLNQLLDADQAALLAQEYGFEVENVAPEVESLVEQEADTETDLIPRAPVVTIMGHVDHGKTTLLDAIRSSNVTESEAGGITQHIGAYEVDHNGKRVVFLDTPGHEAFTTLRARGASVTDVVILVVAADDGVMPQTVEAIDHAKAAGVPIVVAVNKIDKAGAQPDRIRQELSKYELIPEDWGGKTLFGNVSAKKREGIDELLELVLLQAEILDLKANPGKLARGTVIEARLERGKGVVVTVLVQEGTLKVGDPMVIGSTYGRVRALANHKGKRLEEALPGTPVEVQGLNALSEAGQKFAVLKDERTARQIATHRQEKEREKSFTRPRLSLEDLHKHIQSGDIKELNLVVKADVQGSVEALQFSLQKLSGEKVKVNVIHTGIGGISESDVMLASASSAVLVGFNVRPEPKVAELAERESVDLRCYSIIYDVVDDVRKAMEGLLSPTLKEQFQGRVEIRELFHISRLGTVAGAHVISGKITRNASIRLLRDNRIIFTGKLASLKRFKDDAKEVLEGYDCGLQIDGYNDLQQGDQVEAFTIEKVAATLD